MKTYLIAGSRDWTDLAMIRLLVHGLPALDEHLDPNTLVHGGAKGADSMAAGMAQERGFNVVEHKPKWREHDLTGESGVKCGPRCAKLTEYCRAAGPRRNEHMLRMHPNISCAFVLITSPKPDLLTPGSSDMLRRLKAHNTPHYSIWKKRG